MTTKQEIDEIVYEFFCLCPHFLQYAQGVYTDALILEVFH